MSFASLDQTDDIIHPDKYVVITPATTDSKSITPKSNLDHSEQKNKTFEDMQRINQDFFLQAHQEKRNRNKSQSYKKQVKLYPKNHEFKVKIIVLDIKTNTQEVFIKPISNYQSNNHQVNVTFTKQFQKISVYDGQEFLIQIYLVLEGGFQRLIVNTKMQIVSNQSKLFNVIDEITQVKLLCEKQTIFGKIYTKFISMEMKEQIMEDIIDLRIRLINKSEQLNKISKISDLKGTYYHLAKQNMGSRILQKLLNKATLTDILILKDELKPYFQQLITDKYGNYVFQKIIELLSFQLRNEIILAILPFFIKLLKTKTGTYSLQRVLQFLDFNGICLIIQNLKDQLVEISCNQFATFFLQKILQLYPDYNFMITILQIFPDLSTNKNGINIIKTIMNISNHNPYLRYSIYEKIYNNFLQLCFDQYGHYLIEQMFLHFTYQEMKLIIECITLYIIDISNNVFSSSIVRKILQTYGDIIAVPLMNKLMQNGLSELLQTKSGCFVIHRILQLSNHSTKQKFTCTIIQKIPEISTYEKRNKWKQYFSLQ